jgi:DNA-binding transcriptional LysR family regulator
VLAGLGVSLMPRCLVRPGLTAASIREVDLERRVLLGWRRDADSELVGLLRDTALAHAWPGRPGRDGRLDFVR